MSCVVPSRSLSGWHTAAAIPRRAGNERARGSSHHYRAPFRKINELERGDEIFIDMPYGIFTYEMRRRASSSPRRSRSSAA